MGDGLAERIDQWNQDTGYPPATDWPTRLNTAYWLGWYDSQDAMRKGGENARRIAAERAAERLPRWRRLVARLLHV